MESNVKRFIAGQSRVAKLNINNKIYNIYDGVNTIGRNREAIVNVKHLNISQNHAIIITLNGDHFISDLNSSNGTYCDNRKIHPFKLEQLEHNTKIKLGDVLGTYIIQDLDEVNSQNCSQLTQELTQSIYGSTTQLLIHSNSSNNLEDIHEAPTQAIVFTEFKVPKSVKPVKDDIHDAETEVIDIQKVNRDVSVLENDNTNIDDALHKINDTCLKETNIISNTDNNSKLSTTIDVLKNIHDDDDCLASLENHNDINKILNDNDEEATDCEDNIPTNVCVNADYIRTQLVDNNSNDSTEFFKVIEDNNTENSIVESNNISTKCDIQLDQINEETKISPSNNNCENSTKCLSNTSPTTRDEETDCEESDITTLQLAAPSRFQNNAADVDDPNSNDSSDFFKVINLDVESRCPLKSQIPFTKDSSDTQSSSDIITFKKKVCQLSSDSETEDDIKVIRKRKSAMIICTQDLESDVSRQSSKPICKDEANEEDSYVITETDSETETDVNNMKTLEKSIPATQNMSTAGLNDTDCIPATQDNSAKHKNFSQITSGSSESFKFGLTQILSEESQLSSKQKHSDDKNETTSDIITTVSAMADYDPTQKICSSPKELNISANDMKVCNSAKDIPDDTVSDIDLYGPTQKICSSPKQLNISTCDKKSLNKTSDIPDDSITDTELYGPTQKIYSSKQLNLSVVDSRPTNRTLGISDNPITDTDFYGPTQKICFSPKQNILALDKKSHKMLGDPDDFITDTVLYDPTDKICSSPKKLNLSAIDKKPSNKTLGISDEVTDFYGSTQKIYTSSKPLNISAIDRKPSNRTLGVIDNIMNDSEMYGPTQKICTSPKQLNISLIERKPSNRTLGIDDDSITDIDDLYGPTQKICPLAPLNTTVDRKPSDKILGLVSDPVTESEFYCPTQKMCSSPKPLSVSITDRKPSRKSLGIIDNTGDNDINDPTQKIDINIKLRESTKKLSNFKQNKILGNSELYLGNTQEIINDKPLKPNKVNVLSRQDDFSAKTKPISHTHDEIVGQPAEKVCNSRAEDDVFDAPTQVIPVVTEVPKVQKFSFKKMEYNLDKSVSTLLKDDSIVEPVKESIDINFDNIDVELSSSRPSNPVSNVLNETKETEDVEYANISPNMRSNEIVQEKQKVDLNQEPSEGQVSGERTNKKQKTNLSEKDDVSSKKSSRLGRQKANSTEKLDQKKDHGKLKLNEHDDDFVDQETSSTVRKSGRRNPRKTYGKELNLEENDNNVISNVETKQRRLTKQKIVPNEALCDGKEVLPEGSGQKLIKNKESGDINKTSELDDEPHVTKISTGRTKKRRISTDSNQNSDMNINTRPKRESKKTKISLVAEDIPKKKFRNSKRKLLSSEELNDVAIRENGQEAKINVTNVEVNQSIALLESKITKTKRVAKKLVVIDDLHLKVPKNRRSMAVVEQNETLEQPNSSRIANYQKVRNKQNVSKEIKKKSSTQSGLNPKKESLVKIPKPSKRKNVLESTASESSDSGCISTAPSTPKRQKLTNDESVLLSSTERAARRQKPKVVFTMMDSPQMESLIRQLGGSVIDSVNSCTVLVTEHIKRSQKLLCAVGLGKPICSPQWIVESKKSHEFLDPWDYILQDPEAEAKWNFSLKESLMKSREKKLLKNHYFLIQVTTAVDVLKGAIEACGGKCITKIPNAPLSNTFVISSMENQSKHKRILKQHPDVKVLAAEAIFDGVLRQELRFPNHFLN
ncbi:mutator 2 [Rhynchophorus ferrugineus]|uniref:mutator 2 n=1 Tax=Rhynchophorus ferrugineus TaxID=354439 RepID=UPI003FCDE1A4